MDKRTQSYLILGAWVGYILILMFSYKSIIEIMVKQNVVVAFIIYLLFNPAYLLLLWSTYKLSSRAGWKKILAGILLILSFDLVAMPRFLVQDKNLLGSAVSSSNFGSIIMTNLDKIFPHWISFGVFYIVLPIFFFMLAMELYGYVDFVKKFKDGKIGG